MMRTAQDLYEELLAVDESVTIEAKAGRQVDRSWMETICAFANEPGFGGGYLLLGVAASPQLGLFGRTYDIVGVSNPDQIQADLATRCASTFNRPIRPQISVELLQEKPVVVVFVPELAATEKPLFLQSLGLPRGAFRRIGPTDQEGTEEDLIVLYQGHQSESYDASVVPDGDMADLNPESVALYRRLRKEANPVAEELTWSDLDLLRALKAVVMERGVPRPTVTGLLLFGTPMAMRRCFPMMRIDYVRLPGREWIANPDRRFDTVEIRAPLLEAVRRAVAAVRDDLPASFHLPDDSLTRADETVLPLRVLREAVVNAVMHRSYRIHGSILILRYANRLEIRNPGHSLKAEEQLGEPGSRPRNPAIAAVMHDVHLAEAKGSGIRVMREAMAAHDLMPPTFESSRRADQFVVTFLFHHFLVESDLVWLRSLTAERLTDEEARALVFVREAGAIDNAAYRGINRTDTLSASGHLRRLRDLGLLEMKGSGNRTHYVPAGPMLGGALPHKVDPHKADLHKVDPHKVDPHKVDPHKADPHKVEEADPHKAGADPHKVEPGPHKVGAPVEVVDVQMGHLPIDLRARLDEAGPRPQRAVVVQLLLALCGWRPLSARDLARLLRDRDPRDLTRTYLRPLVAAGRLAYTIPMMPQHPNQKYTVPEGP